MALLIAAGLTIWGGLFAASVAGSLGFSLPPAAWLLWHSLVLATLWYATFTAIQRRRGR